MMEEPDHVVSVRLILRQPSSAWLTFSLEDIKIFPHTEPVSFHFSFVYINNSKQTLITDSMRQNNLWNDV